MAGLLCFSILIMTRLHTIPLYMVGWMATGFGALGIVAYDGIGIGNLGDTTWGYGCEIWLEFGVAKVEFCAGAGRCGWAWVSVVHGRCV